MLVDIAGEVTQYPYRSAQVRDHFTHLDRNSKDVRRFEADLAAEAGVRPDNHTVYTIAYQGSTLCVFFHDNLAIFGWTLVVGRW